MDRWVRLAIITPAQGDRMRADVAQLAGGVRPRGPSLATEALGYLGGVIVLVGLGLVTGTFWDRLSSSAHVALLGVVAALLSVAGAGIPDRAAEAGVRLRSVLWAAASVALFGCLALVGSESLAWAGDRVLLLAAGGTGLATAAMWTVHRHVIQHALFFACLCLVVGAATDLLTTASPAPMTAVWLTGAAWCVAAGLGLVDRRAGLVLGSAAVIIASVAIEGEPWGTAMALGAVIALVGVAIAIRDLVVLAVASIGMLVVLPSIVVRYFPGALSAALTLVVAGLLLVAAAVYTARRRRGTPAAPGPAP